MVVQESSLELRGMRESSLELLIAYEIQSNTINTFDVTRQHAKKYTSLAKDIYKEVDIYN